MKTLSITREYFVLNSESGFAYISTTGPLSDGNMKPSSGNGFITDAKFSMK